MRAKAIVRLKFDSEKYLENVFRALEPETRSSPTRRVKVEIGRENDFLVLSFLAKDATALRAALNAYLRWIGTTLSILDFLDNA